jgi:serine/threonine protein kinase
VTPRRQVRPPPPTPLSSGTRIGRYEVRGVLGSGPFGIVYRALDPDHDSDHAIREYLPGVLARRQGPLEVVPRTPEQAADFELGLRFFRDECAVLQRIDHPTLIKVTDTVVAHGTAYMVMPLLTGRSLEQTRLAQARPPREASLRAMLADLLGALERLHAAKVQHRDVSPSRIMMKGDGRLLLLDLQTPRRVASARGDAGPEGPRDGYAPPELYGKVDALPRGPWTDLYSLAATMHFLIAGKPPPAAPRRKADERLAPALARAGDGRHSGEFLAVLEWMLALAPADRPQSVAQVRAALDGQGLPAAYAPPPQVRLASLWRRRGVRRGLAALVLLALLGAGGWRLYRTGIVQAWWISRGF